MNKHNKASLFKTLISAGVFFCVPVSAFGAALPSLTYTNGKGETVYKEDKWAAFILEENATNVVFDSGEDYLFSKSVYFNSGRIENLTINATGKEQDARFYSKSTVSGNITLSGSTAYFSNNGGTIDSGTAVILNGSTFEFIGTGTQIWNISESEINASFALISGTGTVMIRNTTLFEKPTSSWLRLNFASYEILEKTKTLTLVDSQNITTSSGSFMGIEITVNGWSTEDYFASLDWNKDSPTFGKISILHPTVPEPSAFGLLAGTFALGLAVARRRRKNV